MVLPSAIAGACIGKDEETVILAGGRQVTSSASGAGDIRFLDSIFVLEKTVDGRFFWSRAGRLPQPLADGASVSSSEGLLCLGGRNAQGTYSGAIILKWQKSERVIEIVSLPNLPQPISHLSAAVLENTIYVAGGQFEGKPMHNFWALEGGTNEKPRSSHWSILPPWPGPPRLGANLINQYNGDHDSLFLFGGHDGINSYLDAYRYDIKRKNGRALWKSIASLPRPVISAPASACGPAHIIVIGGISGNPVNERPIRFQHDTLFYHTITNTWIQSGKLPKPFADTSAVHIGESYIIPGGISEKGTPTSEVYRAILIPRTGELFSSFDYALLFGYLAVVVMIGVYFSKREKTTKNYFLGNQRIPFWAAGISIMATGVSAIGFMAIPAKAFATNFLYLAGVATWIVVIPLVTWAVVPLYRRLNVTTAFEYLEARFNLATRLAAAFVFCIFQICGRLGIVLYIPSLALSAVTGLDPVICILLMGSLAICYTVLGGIEAVIWTDVLQAVVLLGGAMICLVLCLVGVDGGISGFFSIGWQDEKFTLAMTGWDYTAPVLWVVLVSNITERFNGLTAEQTVVQRFQATATAKEAKKSLWFSIAVSVPWAFIAFGLGAALYAFYKTHPGDLDPTMSIDGIVPLFIVQQVPAGLRGLIIAAIFAAAMSSLDSSMHSVATVLVCDFYDRCRTNSISEKFRLGLARWLTALLGILGTLFALWMASLELPTIWDTFLLIVSLYVGPQTGLFLLGIFTERANGVGVLVGFFISTGIVYLARTYTEMHFFLYGVVGIIACFGIGYLASLILPGQSKVAGLTIYSVNRD